jgi:hypothetical protein
MNDRYNDFIISRDTEITNRKNDLDAMQKNFTKGAIRLAETLDEKLTVNKEIGMEVAQIGGIIELHKKEIARLKAIKNIQYKETTRRTSVTVRFGEQSPWITHVNDPNKNLYSFMPIRMPFADAHTPSVETVVENQLTLKLEDFN